MPAAYAHHTFGETCLESMPGKLKKICLRYRDLFDFGVHGPDILFYYKPLEANEVNGHGQELHHWTGSQFFEICKYVYQNQKENKHAMLAYLMGFLAHFTLDSNCHAYINDMSKTKSLSHNLIESQYEVYLMKRDGKDPMKVDRSKPLHPNRKVAEIIARFFPIEEEKVLTSLKGQKQTLHLFYSPIGWKKKGIRKAIDVLEIGNSFGDLFLDKEILPECEPINETIHELQQEAVDRYPLLMRNLMEYLYDRADLNVYFDFDFEGICK